MTFKKQKTAAALVVIAGTALAGLAAAQAQGATAFSLEQVNAGRESFKSDCAECHNADLTGKEMPMAPALIGKKFQADWAVGDHSAGDLLKFVMATMPKCNGGVLGNSTYADIVSFVLWANGGQPGATDLGVDTSTKVADIVGTPRTNLSK